MSDDIDRLKKALEDMRAANDALTDNGDAMRDVVAAVKPVELETDPEGHGALRDITLEFGVEFHRFTSPMFNAHLNVAALYHKARHMKHLMLDLETFGTKPGSVLRSVGAVAFELTGEMGASFYSNIDEKSCLDAGLTKDPSTVKWWSQQSKEAQDSLLVSPMPLGNVVADFHDFYRKSGARTVWAQGSNFDPALWEAAALAVNGVIPWKFWETRDTRTAYDVGNLNAASVKRDGTYHNALDDAKHQVRCVAKAIAMARGALV